MKHWVAAVVAACVGLSAAACSGDDDSVGDGGGRPSVDAIAESLEGTNLVSDLSDDEAQCFAEAIHDGDMSDALLDKIINGSDMDDSDLEDMDSALSSAAAECGFAYQTG